MRERPSTFVIFLLLLGGLLFLGRPHALARSELIGVDLKQINAQDFPYFCNILRTDGTWGGEDEEICSGTLISPTEIMTAAHCFGRDTRPELKINCGGEWVGQVKSIQKPSRSYWLNADRARSDRDVAIIQLKNAQPQEPLHFSREITEFFQEDGALKTGVSCKIAGFGEDRFGRMGNLQIAEPKSVKFRVENGVILMESIVGYLKTSVDHGDSGGALFCTDSTRNTKLVGVIGAYRYDRKEKWKTANVFATTWLNRDSLQIP